MGNSNNGDGKATKHNSANNEYSKYLAEVQADTPSDIPPFTSAELSYLQSLFATLDKKSNKSIELKDLDSISSLREHIFWPKIRMLFEDEMKKLKSKRINMQLFLFLLSNFHIKTDIDSKYKYLFRIYDWDKDFRINQSDLIKTYQLMYPQAYLSKDLNKLADQTLTRFGSKGEIKLQEFMGIVPTDEVIEVMTFPFNSSFN